VNPKPLDDFFSLFPAVIRQQNDKLITADSATVSLAQTDVNTSATQQITR
jgi:hypothetical protein